MDLSFVIVDFNSAGEVAECIQSLKAFQADLECEFIVVDNSPPDGSHWIADPVVPNVRLLSNARNLGYAAACNRGLHEARAPYVFFLNPDTRYLSGSGRDLIKWLALDPSVALVGPRVLNPDGTRQFSCRSFPGWMTVVCHRHSILTNVFPKNRFTRDYLRTDLNSRPTQVDWASGCCLLARKHLLEEAGGFDEGFFLFFEDVDLAYRLRAHGRKCFYYPSIVFQHGVGSSRIHLRDLGTRAKHLSAARYFKKNLIRGKALGNIVSIAAWLRYLAATAIAGRRTVRAATGSRPSRPSFQ